MTVFQRLDRLERCVVSMFAILSGQDEKLGTEEEVDSLRKIFSEDFSAISRDVKAEISKQLGEL